MYGKGRVFYSTLGHTQEAWNDPDIRKMYFEAIKWVLGMTEGSTASHPRPVAASEGVSAPRIVRASRDGDLGRDIASQEFSPPVVRPMASIPL